ncbi:MAG: sugar phosphate isomerase/epimerase family protein [Pirellulales bacterium]
MFIAASSRCFSDLPMETAMERLVDLQFSSVELMIHDRDGHLKPSDVLTDLDAAVQRCRQTHRLTICAMSFETDTEDEQLAAEQFAACCKLAKAMKVVTVTVRSSELGTPFNAEIERLRRLVMRTSLEGVRVGVLTEGGRMSQDPETVRVMCENAEGLGVTLDPSHFVHGPAAGTSFEPLLESVYHVRLRDSNRQNLQVRVGHGEIEYGRLINQLNRVGYDRALCVDILPREGVDHMPELRKLRLLLESLL